MKSRTRYCALALVSALAAGAALAQRGGGRLINAGPLVGPSYNFISYACIGSDSVGHICTGNIMTAAVTQITSGTCSDTTPEWSFDGSKIAFSRQCGNDSDIYISNPDGSGLTKVTTTTLAAVPTWTPAGQIVYMNIVYQGVPPNPVFCTNGYGGAPCTDLRIVNTEGTGDTELIASHWTNSSQVSLFNISPHVTPDGAAVMFGCGPYGGGSWDGPGLQLCSIPLATGNVTQTPTLLSTVTDAASSDPNIGEIKIGGQYQVVFSSIRPTISTGNLNVFSMNADGTGVTQLTSFVEPIEGQDAGWSPDMSMISFEQDTKGGAASVWVMNADGSNEHSTGIACNPNGCKPRFRP
jgi:hypothetical protein